MGWPIDDLQMSIKRPTSGGQTHNQEAAVQRTIDIQRSSFFYLSALDVALLCLYCAHNCTKHRPRLLPSGSEALSHKNHLHIRTCCTYPLESIIYHEALKTNLPWPWCIINLCSQRFTWPKHSTMSLSSTLCSTKLVSNMWQHSMQRVSNSINSALNQIGLYPPLRSRIELQR